MNDSPHRRYNPLNGTWVLVSPHRSKRPWQGAEEHKTTPRAEYDDECYLCPSNTRANGITNPDYEDIHVFDNDFPALLPIMETPNKITTDSNLSSDLFISQSVEGACRVICYSPKHNLHFSKMNTSSIVNVIDCWADQYRELCENYSWIQIFENRGAAMGCSNAHPHGQIWATSSLPTEASTELSNQQQYHKEHGRKLLLDYCKDEKNQKIRVVLKNKDWTVIVPYWATWPFETIIIANRDVSNLDELSNSERINLAEILKTLIATYDNLFKTEFPYSMGWHNAPSSKLVNQNKYTEDGIMAWQLHGHFYPPLLRSATVKKFMVGYELLSEAQRDITPEQSAILLRNAVQNI